MIIHILPCERLCYPECVSFTASMRLKAILAVAPESGTPDRRSSIHKSDAWMLLHPECSRQAPTSILSGGLWRQLFLRGLFPDLQSNGTLMVR